MILVPLGFKYFKIYFLFLFRVKLATNSKTKEVVAMKVIEKKENDMLF